MITRPMLSGSLENSPKFPVLATPKLDGIRCLRIKGETVSRKFLPIPNKHIQNAMKNLPDGLDGELMTYNDDGSLRTFNQIQSDVMSEDGDPNFKFCVFDYVVSSTKTPYRTRLIDLNNIELPVFCTKLFPSEIHSMEQLSSFEEECLKNGYEGIMIRSPDGPYKCGRSTEKEGYLLKIKRFKDSEARIVGFEEQQENTNSAEEDAFGKIKRSKQLSGMMGKNTLGKFIVREVGNTPWCGHEFAIGTGEGLTLELRQEIWNNRDYYLNKLVKYRYQPHGTKDLPRLPIWVGFRDERDV